MPVAVASNSTANILTLKDKKLRLRPLVRTWVSSNDVPTGKPAPGYVPGGGAELSGIRPPPRSSIKKTPGPLLKE